MGGAVLEIPVADEFISQLEPGVTSNVEGDDLEGGGAPDCHAQGSDAVEEGNGGPEGPNSEVGECGGPPGSLRGAVEGASESCEHVAGPEEGDRSAALDLDGGVTSASCVGDLEDAIKGEGGSLGAGDVTPAGEVGRTPPVEGEAGPDNPEGPGEGDDAPAGEVGVAPSGEEEQEPASEVQHVEAGEVEQVAACEGWDASAGEGGDGTAGQGWDAAAGEEEHDPTCEVEDVTAGEGEHAGPNEVENVAAGEGEDARTSEVESVAVSKDGDAPAGEGEDATAGEGEDAPAGEREDSQDIVGHGEVEDPENLDEFGSTPASLCIVAASANAEEAVENAEAASENAEEASENEEAVENAEEAGENAEEAVENAEEAFENAEEASENEEAVENAEEAAENAEEAVENAEDALEDAEDAAENVEEAVENAEAASEYHNELDPPSPTPSQGPVNILEPANYSDEFDSPPVSPSVADSARSPAVASVASQSRGVGAKKASSRPHAAANKSSPTPKASSQPPKAASPPLMAASPPSMAARPASKAASSLSKAAPSSKSRLSIASPKKAAEPSSPKQPTPASNAASSRKPRAPVRYVHASSAEAEETEEQAATKEELQKLLKQATVAMDQLRHLQEEMSEMTLELGRRVDAGGPAVAVALAAVLKDGKEGGEQGRSTSPSPGPSGRAGAGPSARGGGPPVRIGRLALKPLNHEVLMALLNDAEVMKGLVQAETASCKTAKSEYQSLEGVANQTRSLRVLSTQSMTALKSWDTLCGSLIYKIKSLCATLGVMLEVAAKQAVIEQQLGAIGNATNDCEGHIDSMEENLRTMLSLRQTQHESVRAIPLPDSPGAMPQEDAAELYQVLTESLEEQYRQGKQLLHSTMKLISMTEKDAKDSGVKPYISEVADYHQRCSACSKRMAALQSGISLSKETAVSVPDTLEDDRAVVDRLAAESDAEPAGEKLAMLQERLHDALRNGMVTCSNDGNSAAQAVALALEDAEALKGKLEMLQAELADAETSCPSLHGRVVQMQRDIIAGKGRVIAMDLLVHETITRGSGTMLPTPANGNRKSKTVGQKLLFPQRSRYSKPPDIQIPPRALANGERMLYDRLTGLAKAGKGSPGTASLTTRDWEIALVKLKRQSELDKAVLRGSMRVETARKLSCAGVASQPSEIKLPPLGQGQHQSKSGAGLHTSQSAVSSNPSSDAQLGARTLDPNLPLAPLHTDEGLLEAGLQAVFEEGTHAGMYDAADEGGQAGSWKDEPCNQSQASRTSQGQPLSTRASRLSTMSRQRVGTAPPGPHAGAAKLSPNSRPKSVGHHAKGVAEHTLSKNRDLLDSLYSAFKSSSLLTPIPHTRSKVVWGTEAVGKGGRKA